MTMITPGDEIAFTKFDFAMDKGDFTWMEPTTGGSTDLFDQFLDLDGSAADSLGIEEHLFASQDAHSLTPVNSPPESNPPAASRSSNLSVDSSFTARSAHYSHYPAAVANSNYTQHLRGGGGRDGVGSGQASSETSEQRNIVLANHEAGGGSISDSELLSLEGLKMRSPKVNSGAEAPSSVPSSPPSHAQPTLPSAASSPKKPSRLENIYATIRKAATLKTKTKQHQQPQTVPIPQTVIPVHVESAKRATHRLRSESFAMPSGSTAFIASPSPAHTMGDLSDHSHESMEFVSGALDDPFYEPGRGLAPPGRITGPSIPNTPLLTPHLNGSQPKSIDPNSLTFATSTPITVTTTGWPMDASIAADAGIADWSSSSYIADSSNGWWASHAGGPDFDMGGMGDFSHAGAKRMPMQGLPLQMHQPYEYVGGGRSSSAGSSVGHDIATTGLMIRMPQPRTPTTAPLLHHDAAMGPGSYFTAPHDQQHQFAPGQAQARNSQRYHTERRPKPRAPSSGARHHGAMTSPRKQRQASTSSSSPSPTPRGARRSTSMQSLQGGSMAAATPSQAAVRKRRSFQNARQRSDAAPRTPNPSGDGAGGGGGGGGGIGFVNYTPSDSAVLMTGVAPSGSSKTKARREKEAAERQRRLSEALYKAVTAAGGDVTKLKEEEMIA